jgi:RHS repeat-associated protein
MSIYDCQLKHGPEGHIVEKTETVNGKAMTWIYAYDKEGLLTSAHLDGRTVCDINYDREGRRANDYFPHLDTHYRNYAYSVMDNRLQQAGNNGYTHNENGFRSIWNSGGRYTLYEYAPDYRLVKAEKRETGELFEFTHDEEGRREAKYCNGELVEAYRWLDFLRLDGFHDGESAYRFAYRDGERTPYAMKREDGAAFSLFHDQVGSLRVVADAGGNVIKEVLYDPFGGIVEDSNPGLRIPIGFAGGLHDRDLGFVRFGWRDYDTFTSRWTAPDPLGDAGGDPDWYGYCLDDPVNGNDPMGLWTNEYGEQESEGRTIFEVLPDPIFTPFMTYGTKKKVRQGLRKEKEKYQDNSDWEMRRNLEEEAKNFGIVDSFLSTYRFDTDEETIKSHSDKAKRKIGK